MNAEHASALAGDSLRRVLDHLTAGVLLLDHRLGISFMNPAAEMLLASSLRQARGVELQDLVMGAASAVEGFRRCLQTGQSFTERELPLILPGQQAITVELAATPVVEDERVIGLVVELHQMDRQLRISREEALIAQHNTLRVLIRNLAHEIKNPLGGVRGAAQLLERELSSPDLEEYTGVIIREADRLRLLVDRMLSPMHPPVYSQVNIHEVLERVRTLLLAEVGDEIRVDRDYDPSIPLLMGDSDQLIQALLNVAGNGVQAMEGRGVLLLRTRVQRQCTIGHRFYRLVARIDVIDNGPGIPEALLNEVFYPTITGRPGGAGLGLSIAQTLISQHGGLIECFSRPGETMFTLWLPLESADG